MTATHDDTDTITLRRAAYDEMIERIEDLEDQLALAGTEERIERLGFKTATQDYLPDAAIGRILDGESRVRIWREHRGITARALAEAAGISGSYLSEIEASKKPGSLDAMASIAKALKISLDRLVGE